MFSPGKSKGRRSWEVQPAAAAAAKSIQSCPTLHDPLDRSPPGSSIHGIFQARVLEWGAIAFSVSATRRIYHLLTYSYRLLTAYRIVSILILVKALLSNKIIPQVESLLLSSMPANQDLTHFLCKVLPEKEGRKV